MQASVLLLHDAVQAAGAVLHRSKLHNHIDFLAHGMGLVSHEAPRLTGSDPVLYDAYDADEPLEAGMVIRSKPR